MSVGLQNSAEVKIDRLIRSSRRTIGLEIEKNGELWVRAPKRASLDEIYEFIDEKRSWINKNQKLMLQTHRSVKAKQFVHGEKFLYLGREYKLKFIDTYFDQIIFSDGLFLSKRHKDSAADLLVRWYRDKASKVINERVSLHAAQHDLSYRQVRITQTKSRWGSCGINGNLQFSWLLIMAPLEVIDYVVVHELAHLAHPNHSRRFWSKVGRMYPNYKPHQKWLRENGYRLTLEPA